MLIALKNDIMNLKTYHETNTGTQSSTRNSKEIVKTCRRIHKRKGENLGGVGNRIYNQHREKGMRGIGGGTEGGGCGGGERGACQNIGTRFQISQHFLF